MLNRGSDSLWTLKIPGCPSKKSRGVTPASWPNLPFGLWPSWPHNHPHTLIGFITVSSPPVSWCVVGILEHYGCRRIIQVDAAHLWWMRRFPFNVKRFECLEKHYINATNYYYYSFYYLTRPLHPWGCSKCCNLSLALALKVGCHTMTLSSHITSAFSHWGHSWTSPGPPCRDTFHQRMHGFQTRRG